MPPAFASRAGGTPEASRDRSSGTFGAETVMKATLTLIAFCSMMTSLWSQESAIEEFMNTHPRFELPKSAETLLIKLSRAERIVGVNWMTYRRYSHTDYLGVTIEFEIKWGFEGIYHQCLVLRKPSNEADWSKAEIFDTDENIFLLFAKNEEKDLIKGLTPRKPIQAEQAGETGQPATKPVDNNNLSITFRMTKKGNLLLDIENKSDKEQVFKSNIIGVLDLKVFDFPTRGYLQFRTDKADILFLGNHEVPDWRSAGNYSSQPFPPAKVEGLKQIIEIKIPAHEIQSFHIEYAKAIDITTVRYPKTDQLPREFRIRLVINTMQHEKLTETEIISEWFSCEKLVSVRR